VTDSPLTTVSDVKAKLRQTVATDDALLARMILAASARVRTYLGRDLDLQAYTQAIDGTGTDRVTLPQAPVTAVASVQTGLPGTARTLLIINTDYLFDATGLIRVVGAWIKGPQNVQVTWTAGYELTPWDIQDACAELVATTYKELDRLGYQSKSIGGEVISFKLADFPAAVKATLNLYRRVGPQ
jgi:hypothetical protein